MQRFSSTGHPSFPSPTVFFDSELGLAAWAFGRAWFCWRGVGHPGLAPGLSPQLETRMPSCHNVSWPSLPWLRAWTKSGFREQGKAWG
jgi:hypothetical protein